MTGLLSFDFETFLIADRAKVRHGAHEVNVGPYVTPEAVLGSLAWVEGEQVRSEVLDPEAMRCRLAEHLRTGGTVVAQHAPFDVDVLLAAFPAEWPLWRTALAEGRVLDTKVLDVLYRLSVGWYDRPDPAANWATPELKVRTLAELAAGYCGLTLDKDPDVRLGFGEWKGRVAELPPRFRAYAAQDAIATLGVALHLHGQPGAPWDAAAQTRAEVALYSMEKHGMAIDRGEALRLRALFRRDLPALQAALVQHGLARWEPVPKTRATQRLEAASGLPRPASETVWRLEGTQITLTKHYKGHSVRHTATPGFHLNTAAIRDRLAALATELELDDTELARTETGLLSITHDEWADRIPAGRADLESWAHHAKLTKILTAYLELYSKVDRVFPRWRTIGARSGRMSASSPALQQVPKRKYGIRSLFVPSEGHTFVIADYATQEVYCLAEIMHHRGLDGPLLEALRAGEDLHTQTARKIFLNDHKDIIEWPQNVFAQLRDCLSDERLPQEGAGSTMGTLLTNGDTEPSASEARLCSPTEWLSRYGWVPSLTAGSCVIPATTLRALTQSTCLWEHSSITCKTVLERAAQENLGLDARALAILIGKGACRLIVKHTTENGRSAIPGAITKQQRQNVKALVFGCPGGLGAKRLAEYARKTFNLDWDLATAKRMRDAFLSTYPDIAAYLESLKTGLDADLRRASGRGLAEWRRELGASNGWELRQIMRRHPDPAVRGVLYTAERSLTVTLPTGFVRKGCTFTEGANTAFQGLAAAVTKEAAWRFFAEVGGPCDAPLVAVVHDEIVVECVPEAALVVARGLERCMLDAFRAVCPHVGHLARVEVTAPAARWGAATTATGDAI